MLIVCALLAALQATAPSPSPLPSPTASPSAAPSATPAPSAAPSATPSATPLPTLTPAPGPLPTPLVLPPTAPPQILAVTVSEPIFHSGETISATVITSTNVAAVELRVIGRAIRFQRSDFGVFHLNYKLPHIPRRYRRDYAADVVAMNAFDMYVHRNVTISLR